MVILNLGDLIGYFDLGDLIGHFNLGDLNAPGAFLAAPGCFRILFSKVSLTLRKFKQIVEVPQVCLRNGALFFAFLEWL